jgi:hypothetical protein
MIFKIPLCGYEYVRNLSEIWVLGIGEVRGTNLVY